MGGWMGAWLRNSALLLKLSEIKGYGREVL